MLQNISPPSQPCVYFGQTWNSAFWFIGFIFIEQRHFHLFFWHHDIFWYFTIIGSIIFVAIFDLKTWLHSLSCCSLTRPCVLPFNSGCNVYKSIVWYIINQQHWHHHIRFWRVERLVPSSYTHNNHLGLACSKGQWSLSRCWKSCSATRRQGESWKRLTILESFFLNKIYLSIA